MKKELNSLNEFTEYFSHVSHAAREQQHGATAAGKDVRGTESESMVELHSAMKRFFLIFIASAVLAGCSLETVTRPSTTVFPPANFKALSESSNVGSLRANADSVNNESIIRPGDQIQITVWGYPEFNTTTTVKEFGTITVPLIGEVIAAGLTVGQLRDQLKQRLSEYVKGNARLTVTHIGMDKQVSVMGAVTKQGNYPALTELTLIEVLSDAGGPTATADLTHIRIYRHSMHAEVIDVDLEEYLQTGNVQYIPRVGPGDVVFVPEKQNFVLAFSAYASEVVFLFGFFALLR